MKKIKFLILVVLSCLLGLFAVACNQVIEFDYNIDFVVDGEVVATVGTNGEKISMPQNPTKEDYTFDGWYWDEGEWNDEFTLNSILDQPLQDKNHYKVYAKWKGILVTVMFIDNDLAPVEVEYGEDYQLPLPTISDGNIFLGWELATEIESTMMTDSEGKSLTKCDFNESIVLLPVWKQGKVVISFDSQGGGSIEDIVVWYQEEFGNLPVPVRNGYDFLGWYTEIDGEKRVENNDIVTFNQNTTLYARWEKNTSMKITYDGNGATGGETLWQSAKKGESITLRQNGFTRIGYIFERWECDGKTYAPNEKIPFKDGEFVMKAVWKGISYKINFISDRALDGTMLSQTFTYGEKKKLSANAFLRKGYHFIGWADADGRDDKIVYTDEQEVENLTAVNGAEFNLRAVWKANTYKIFFKEGADSEVKYTLQMDYDNEYILYAYKYYFEKTGYEQTGWKAVSGVPEGTVYDLDEHVSNLTAEDGDEIVLIPTWELITYTLKYIGNIPGSGSNYILATYELDYFEEHTLIECTFEREGYYCSSWNFQAYALTEDALNPNYNYGYYEIGAIVSGLSIQNGGVIWAISVWDEVNYTLRIHANDGTGETKDYEATYKSHTSVQTDWMTGKGEKYSFAGFYNDNQKLSTYIWDDIPRKQGEIVNIYALWKYDYEGLGTVASPYIIDCPEAMENMAVISFANAYDVGNDTWGNRLHFRFTADIDMTGRTFTPIGWYEYSTFYGSIDGNGHTVYGLNITLPSDKSEGLFYKPNSFGYAYHDESVGLICKAGGESSVKNIQFKNPTMRISGKTWAQCVGFVVGSGSISLSNITINEINIDVTGDRLAPVYSNAEISLYVGGFVGNPKNNSGTVVMHNCYISGEIKVTAPMMEVGGAVTYGGRITSSAANLMLVTEGASETDLTTATVGGLGIGIKYAKECYSVTKVYGSEDNLKFIGASFDEYRLCEIENLYYSDGFVLNYTGTVEELESDGVKTADQNLKNPDWIVENLPSLRTAQWTIADGYPIKGDRNLSVIEVTTKEEFLALSGKNLTEKYILKCDIDMTGVAWEMPSVYGEFDGNGHTIYGLNLFAEDRETVGLFAENYGIIKNVLLKGLSIAAIGTAIEMINVGGVVGYNEGTVAYCGMEGVIAGETVNGSLNVGGIAGCNLGEIYCCYATCDLNGVATELETRAIIVIKKGQVKARVFGIAYCEGNGLVKSCYTTGAYSATATLEVAIAGVSNVVKNSFSFASLTYNESASTCLVEAVGNNLAGCSLQKINGVAVNGSSEIMFKTPAYLNATVGIQEWAEQTNLSENPYAAWKFVSGKLPILYFE